MKYLLLLLLATIFLVSCEDLETNDTALQANIDNVFYKSVNEIGYKNQNNFFVLEGYTQSEKLTLKFKSPGLVTLPLGGESNNSGTYEDKFGNVYTTGPNATGEIIITNRRYGGRFTGTFNFTAISPALDTIVISNGVFYDIATLGDVIDDDPGNDGTFSATIDNNPLSPNSVAATDSGNSIIILASNNDRSIFIKVPIDVEAGFYDLPENGFSAKYTIGTDVEDATTGNVVIVSHNVGAKTIAGTFFFTTENHVIEQGQFSVTYQ